MAVGAAPVSVRCQAGGANRSVGNRNRAGGIVVAAGDERGSSGSSARRIGSQTRVALGESPGVLSREFRRTGLE